MTQNKLQHLLAKYQDGTLTDEELERLNVLTYRDEVLAAAESRARVIVRHRTMRVVGFAVAFAAVLGAGVWMLAPRQEQPMVAELRQPAVTPVKAVQQEPVPEAVAVEEYVAPAVNVGHRRASQPAVDAPAAEEPQDSPAGQIMTAPLPAADEPVVVCNNQCDADSVISDIWKFLSA